MSYLVARHVQLHQVVHLPDLLGQGDELVVVGHQTLQVGQAADGGGEVRQLATAATQLMVGKSHSCCFQG